MGVSRGDNGQSSWMQVFSQGRDSCPSTFGVALLPGDSRPFPFLDPLPLEQLSLSNGGHSTSLQASWRAASSGSTSGYTGTLRETKSQEQVRNVTVGSDWTNVTLENLVPGRQYTLEMAAMAGPYRSPVRSATDWTCECDNPTSPCCRAQPQPACESRTLTAGEWPMWGVGNWRQGHTDRQTVGCHLEPRPAMLEVKGSEDRTENISKCHPGGGGDPLPCLLWVCCADSWPNPCRCRQWRVPRTGVCSPHSLLSLPGCLFSLRPPGSSWSDSDQHPAPHGALGLLGQGCWGCGAVPPPALQQEPRSTQEHHSGAQHPQLYVPGAVPWHSVLPEGDCPRWSLQILVTLCH